MGKTCDMSFGGAALTLTGERAIWWPAEQALLVADIHLGKPASFRERGTPVPEEVTRGDLARLDALLDTFPARRLIVLGDLAHDRAAWADVTLTAFAAWRAHQASLECVLVRGNHDRWAADPPESLDIEVVEPGWVLGGIAMHHEPPTDAQRAHQSMPVLCGHLHPGIRVAPADPCKRRRAGMRGACFWFSGSLGVLPAFGSFTGCMMIKPVRGDRVFLVGDERVLEVGNSGVQRSQAAD